MVDSRSGHILIRVVPIWVASVLVGAIEGGRFVPDVGSCLFLYGYSVSRLLCLLCSDMPTVSSRLFVLCRVLCGFDFVISPTF